MIWQSPLRSLSIFHPDGGDSGAASGSNKANRAKAQIVSYYRFVLLALFE